MAFNVLGDSLAGASFGTLLYMHCKCESRTAWLLRMSDDTSGHTQSPCPFLDAVEA